MSMGIGAVVMLSALMQHGWHARQGKRLLVDMSRVNGAILLLLCALRLADLAAHGKLHHLTVPDRHLLFFALETAFFLVPAALFFVRRVQHHRGALVAAASATVVAGALWRIDTFLTCYDAGGGWRYFPSFGEIAVTVGMAALGGAFFILVSRLFPVVVVAEPRRHASLRARVAQGASDAVPARATADRL
jgi:Ni/Fe-hydrogenase subunit HybB-like protein